MAKFEESIKELEKIVKTLEDGEPSLDGVKIENKSIGNQKIINKNLVI